MVTRTDRSGIAKEFSLDIEWILAEEARDPRYSFFKDLDGIADNPRLTTVKRMAEAMGQDFEAMLKSFSIFDIVAIFADCCKESGFIPQESNATV